MLPPPAILGDVIARGEKCAIRCIIRSLISDGCICCSTVKRSDRRATNNARLRTEVRTMAPNDRLALIPLPPPPPFVHAASLNDQRLFLETIAFGHGLEQGTSGLRVADRSRRKGRAFENAHGGWRTTSGEAGTHPRGPSVQPRTGFRAVL